MDLSKRKWFATDFPKKPLQRQKNRMNAGSKDQQSLTCLKRPVKQRIQRKMKNSGKNEEFCRSRIPGYLKLIFRQRQL